MRLYWKVYTENFAILYTYGHLENDFFQYYILHYMQVILKLTRKSEKFQSNNIFVYRWENLEVVKSMCGTL